MKNILLTGGAGYIGSHTYLSLIESSYNPIILDNFSNSKPKVLNRLKEISKKDAVIEIGDVCDSKFISKIIDNHNIDGVIHFAALKSVEDSVSNPLEYFKNNVGGLISVIDGMKESNCNKLIFSGSACVYGNNKDVPVTENSQRNFTNPYGQTKIICEDIIKAIAEKSELSYVILRYFNPVGCHKSGEIGEDPIGKISNLIPSIANVASGNAPFVKVFGNDYNTLDGTGVRDFIHVMDVAEGHINALKTLDGEKLNLAINLGTGNGTSVLELIKVYEKVSEKKIHYKFYPKRLGDVASIYADASLAKIKINWESKRSIVDMCESSWIWKSKNPSGY